MIPFNTLAIGILLLHGMVPTGTGNDRVTVRSGAMPVQDSRPYEPVTESPRLYDPAAAENLQGIVVDMETVTPKEGAAAFVQLSLKTERGVVQVHLGPQWFMDEQIQRMELDKGREVEVRGSKNVIDGKPVFIAAEIRNPRRDQRLRLRHADGTPVWSSSEHAS